MNTTISESFSSGSERHYIGLWGIFQKSPQITLQKHEAKRTLGRIDFAIIQLYNGKQNFWYVGGFKSVPISARFFTICVWTQPSQRILENDSTKTPKSPKKRCCTKVRIIGWIFNVEQNGFQIRDQHKIPLHMGCGPKRFPNISPPIRIVSRPRSSQSRYVRASFFITDSNLSTKTHGKTHFGTYRFCYNLADMIDNKSSNMLVVSKVFQFRLVFEIFKV